MIEANFERDGNGEIGSGLVKVDIRLDTGAMLDSMVQQARMVVFKAVAKATSATDSLNLDAQAEAAAAQPSATLSGFSSALNLSSSVPPGDHQPAHRLQKARSSALKLNSVLQGGSAKNNGSSALDKTRKIRSVQWDNRTDLLKVRTAAVPSPKRQRVTDQTARLRSFKSFGRPHAGDFGSGPRNATFGDFGRKPIWGRDGKLANHPAPMNPNDNQEQDLMTTTPKATKNATFDFQRPPIHLSSGFEKGASNMSSIPRTATALEGLLMEKAGIKGRKGF